ncbi:hypothetical protein SLEP1_g47059 [Rubroshorea leprosula]|uniref:Large ribosomal RNA subunit accumulation protein YCED homolog 2, chloroplastic n=1 Tax=Rubroshorea leprosula TaxID=152421 RepID=A0AAV5LQ36_9ROSI|nr:hypothetical protein SLEP1_g47059 [Rubroshorea leprosula]
MAEARHLVRNINQIPKSLIQAKQKSHKLHSQTLRTRHSSAPRKQDFSLITKKASRSPRRLISISTKDGRWDGDWSCDFLISLKDLRLSDLVEDEHKNAQVSINLRIQKHASFGLSVDGRIITSFTRKCSYCSSPYCREIDTNFNVWVLSSSRDNDAAQLPEIGGDDPSLSH